MKHIVLIDDDRFIRDLIATKLTSLNYSVATAATAGEGLNTITHQTPDLILLDLELPDQHGLEVLETLKADPATAQVPVIIFSNNDDDKAQKEAFDKGASAFFVKVTIDVSELQEHIEKFLAK